MLKTTISPMDDDDLSHNFKKYRNKYWTKHGLYLPEHGIVKFGKIEKSKIKGGNGDIVACHYSGVNYFRIVISEEHKFLYFAAKISLLHEMAHLYLEGRGKHGPRFKREIDRLYALGAFRTLI